MRERLRSHVTYANVMATIAVFLVLGGGSAVALNGSNTVQSDDLGPGAQVKAADVAANAVNGSKVVDNSLTGADIQDSSLDSSVLQSRVTGTCSAGDAVESVAQNGAVTCVAPSLSSIEGTSCDQANYSGVTHTYYIAGVAEIVCRQVVMSPVVGNAVVENNEQCDDGNATNGDGCSDNGTLEFKP
jgi:cysteine-rich repeat protein